MSVVTVIAATLNCAAICFLIYLSYSIILQEYNRKRIKTYDRFFLFLLGFNILIQAASLYGSIEATFVLPDTQKNVNRIVFFVLFPTALTFVFQMLSLLAMVELLRLFAVLDEKMTSKKLLYIQMGIVASLIVFNAPLIASLYMTWLDLENLILPFSICTGISLIGLCFSGYLENWFLVYIAKLVSKKTEEFKRLKELKTLKAQLNQFIRLIMVTSLLGFTAIGIGASQFVMSHIFDACFLSFFMLSLKTYLQIWFFQVCKKTALLKKSKVPITEKLEAAAGEIELLQKSVDREGKSSCIDTDTKPMDTMPIHSHPLSMSAEFDEKMQYISIQSPT